MARPSDRRGRPAAVWRPKRALRSERWVGVGSGVRPGRPEAGWRPKRALRSERRARVESGRRFSSARPPGRRLDCPSGLSSRYFGPAHELRVARNVVYWAKPLLGSRSMRDPRFMNSTLVLWPCRTMPFMRSTYPFMWGCAIAAQSTQM